MVNSNVAKHNQKHSGVNVKIIRYYIRDRVVVFGSTFYGLCRHIEEPGERGLPQEYNVMQVCLSNNIKALVNPVFYGIVTSKKINKPK